ncbi:glyceraldehyde-3-phosphate dehydrogenase, putative [Colletotrichum tofieldiae]|nr:glyceraldehyde-3-phosphate dehydrogenase [Colletotrichum tofieldiae]GKT78768.1 glyceraldehyde-3-phosphate dehydrogenase, putative [Colletotrichum tofieldiae]
MCSAHLFGGVNLGNVGKEVEDTAGVTPLVVVPGDQLDKVVVQRDTGLGIEDGGIGVADHVGGDNVVLGFMFKKKIIVGGQWELTLEGTLSGLLDGLLDLVVAGALLDADSQVNDGDVGSGHTHGHAGELAVELRNDLADSLGGTSAAGNDVLSSGAATTPVLGGRTVDGLLVGAGVLPGDGSGVTLSVELDLLAVDDKVVAILLDVTVEDAVGGVVLEHVGLRDDTSATGTRLALW